MPAKLIEYFNKSPAAVTFEVDGVRPIVNFGQGWEKSIWFDIHKSDAMKKSALTDRTIGIKEEFIAKMFGKMPDTKAQIHKSKIQVQ